MIRAYKETDCKALTELFYQTVHTVNVKDYTKEQLEVWAPKEADLKKWNQSLSEHYAVVFMENGVMTGFGDMDKTGYLDRLYVHKDYQKRGIATAICDELENVTNTEKFVTHASVTARGFFEKRGYRIVKEQQVERQGIFLTNYIMEKQNNEYLEV